MKSLQRYLSPIGDLLGLAWDHLRDLLVSLEILPRYDFDFITARIATGAAPVDRGFVRALLRAGITHVIDVTNAIDDRSLLPANFPYIWDPTADDGMPKPAQWFSHPLFWAGTILPQNSTAKIYVHCTSGINRGPSMAYAIIRGIQRWSAPATMAAFRKYRPQARLAYAGDAERALLSLGYVKPDSP